MILDEICDEVLAQAGTETASSTPCSFETYRWSEAPGDFSLHGAICRNNPITDSDSSGLWSSLEHSSDSDWMTVKADRDGDPIGPLAYAVGLESGQAFGPKGWLKTASGRAVGSLSDVRADAHYRLPNKVYVMSGHTAWARYLRLARQEMAHKAKSLGFKVVEMRNASKEEIVGAFSSDYVYGVVTFSHGEEGAIFSYGTPSESDVSSQSEPLQYLQQWTVEPNDISINYRLKFLFVFACQSARADWGQFVSRNQGELVTYQGFLGVENMLWEGYDPFVQWRVGKMYQFADWAVKSYEKAASAMQSSWWLQLMPIF